MNDTNKKPLSVERAAFLLLRVRKAFRKKLSKQTKKDATPSNVNEKGGVSLPAKPPLLRSRTLPAMVVPGLSILQAQIEATVTQSISVKRKIPQVVEPSSLYHAETNQSPHSAELEGAEGFEGSPEFHDIQKILGGLLNSDSSISGKQISSPTSMAKRRSTTKGKLSRFRNGGVRSEKGSPNQYSGLSPTSRTIQNQPGQGQGLQGQPRRLQRRHSLESNSNLAGLLENRAEDIMGPPPDVTSTSSARPRLTFAVPDVRSSVPASPACSNKRNNKADKTATAEWKKESLELLVAHGRNLSKSDLKKMEKVSGVNIHLQALFAAVETGQIEKARTILEATDVDINCCNSDGFTLLDIAVLLGNFQMARILISLGAKEASENWSKEVVSDRLNELLDQVDSHSDKLMSSDAGQCELLDKRRARLLRKMKAGLDHIKIPASPSQARVEVTTESSALIWWIQPECSAAEGLCTKFRVQWSLSADFQPLTGQLELRDLTGANESSEIKVSVDRLPANQRCYFRLACGNIAGFSSFKETVPPSILLSAWRSIDGRKPRFAGRLSQLDDLLVEVRNARPDQEDNAETPAKQRKNQTKMSLRQLFGANVKLQRNLRRGVYLACVVYHEDRVLVTNEEFPPVVDIDETYPTAVHNDFHWFMKVACTWSDVKTMRQDLEKSLSSSNTHFRIRLLQAAAQLQSALGVQDLGNLYHQPIKDSQGTLLISTICHLPSAKAISPSLNFKWIPVSKLHKKSISSEDANAADVLLHSLPEMLTHSKISNQPLEKGLYLGYLKVRSSVDLLRVLVPKDMPNMLPHCRIRQNPWVSSEEWQWIVDLSGAPQASEGRTEDDNDNTEQKPDDSCPTACQKLFQSQIVQTANKLLRNMGVDLEAAAQHRFYCGEVIELNSDVSLLLLLPPADSVCAIAGQQDALFEREDFLTIPVQVFEMMHMRTYQRDLIGRYSRISSMLEIDVSLAQHAVREAFSSVELSEAKQRITRLNNLQSHVDATWRGSRWIMDVLCVARDRNSTVGIDLASLLPSAAPSQQVSEVEFPEIPQESALSQTVATPRCAKRHPLLKTTSDNEILDQKVPSLCTVCSVPLELPGYVSSCSSCACSRVNLNKDQSRSNENLSNSALRKSSRKGISRSENQLHSIQFQPYLDAEESDSNVFTYQTAAVQEIKSSHKVRRGGVSSSMRSNSQESEVSHCSRHSKSSHTPSLTSLSSAEGDPDSLSTKSADPVDGDIVTTGIIQVYAAYESGLACGTSVKLHVTSKTTAREVVDLVVRQLNMAVTLKGKDGPVYGADELKNFCMVAVIGARERCLRDDFRPLQLQNPWRKGRLYVRQKKDVLAAIEQSTRQTIPAAI